MNWLREQGISDRLIADIEHFRAFYKVAEEDEDRVANPAYPFFGKEALETAITVLLDGDNLLITGEKATGKNVLAENLSRIFNRPLFNASFNINTDSHSLLGSDTFKNNEVVFQPGLIMECARRGGFAVLDEINMAKNEAISVLHSALDYRRIIDISGYQRQPIHEATRFIGTMNYGYAGTRELNEALASRFMILELQPLGKDTLEDILAVEFADLNPDVREEIIGFFLDIQAKALNSEISNKVVDLRGLLAGIRSIRRGLRPARAFTMGMINKTFDEFERKIANDVMKLRFPKDMDGSHFFDK
ncbi:MAG: AAA family ATPase [Eubacteriales bacterium]|nr:AAA family ATPase [Eubacteriales bacterium]